MSFDVTSVDAPGIQASVALSEPGPHDQGAPAVAYTDSVRVDTIPSLPPPDVLEGMGLASRAYDQLRASGRELAFVTDPRTAHLTIQIQDLRGREIRTITPSEALDAASGAPIE